MSKNSRQPRELEEQSLAGWLGDDALAADSGQDSALALLASLDVVWAEGPSEEGLAAMRAALDAWWAEQNMTVYYDWLATTSVGRVYVAATDKGVLSVDFDYEDEGPYLQHLVERHVGNKHAVVEHAPERLQDVMQQVREYFEGKRKHFDFLVDLSGATDFQRQVLETTSRVPAGQVVTYKEIARRMGKPKAARAVGNALGRNPVPILIPCHRVVPQNGLLGGYSGRGGPATKARLLALEGVLPGRKGQYAVSGQG